MLETGPAQQPDDAHDEPPDNDLILVAVSLKAHGGDIFFLRVLADVEVLAQAKGLCALRAGGGRGDALGDGDVAEPVVDGEVGGDEGGAAEEEGVGGRGIGVVEGDDGAVLVAGAFAEGWASWRGLLAKRWEEGGSGGGGGAYRLLMPGRGESPESGEGVGSAPWRRRWWD